MLQNIHLCCTISVAKLLKQGNIFGSSSGVGVYCMWTASAGELLCNATARLWASPRQPESMSTRRQTERRQQRLPQHTGGSSRLSRLAPVPQHPGDGSSRLSRLAPVPQHPGMGPRASPA